MPKTEVAVDRQLLIDTISKVEEGGPLDTQSQLWKTVAEDYNKTAVVPITPAIVCLRVAKWSLPIKTQKARIVTPKDPTEPKITHTKVKEPTIYTPATSSSVPLIPIAIPAGLPHVALKTFDEESIQDWCNKNLEEGAKKGLKYGSLALVYWARNYYNPDTDTFAFTRAVIRTHLGDTLQPAGPDSE